MQTHRECPPHHKPSLGDRPTTLSQQCSSVASPLHRRAQPEYPLDYLPIFDLRIQPFLTKKLQQLTRRQSVKQDLKEVREKEFSNRHGFDFGFGLSGVED
ncbi:hypothetical protein Ddye_027879 [Dipteronia dyeriana]|uniref:Uncharacterized protein n=1 Tax=Dipteronia dyeriana TaxID=168575 RepID=A0AAD9TQW5_9ROSI|nr:hypothetical protein Ddye_027879 [Dipteronia dyeriana]